MDYRRLNQETHKDSYPLLCIDDTIEDITGAQWFLTVVLKRATGKYGWMILPRRKLPFQLETNCGSLLSCHLGNVMLFEWLMESRCFWIYLCPLYLEDILILGHSLPHHLTNLCQVFDSLRRTRLKLSPKKCIVFRQEVKYWGHVVSREAVPPDPDTVDAVRSWLTPTLATEFKGFLCLCSYYRCFVTHFVDIAESLY